MRFRTSRVFIARASILLVLPLCQGCVAVGVYGRRTIETEHVGELFRDGTMPKGAVPISSVMREWGEPNAKETLGPDREEWTYRFGLRWKGVLLVLLLPIPLMVPVGYDRITLLVENGMAVSAKGVKGSGIKYICGVIPGICFDFGWAVRRF